MTRSSFKHDIAAMATECGSVTLTSVMARYPEKTKAQVELTLTTASSEGLIHLIGTEDRKGPGRRRGIWGPGPRGDTMTKKAPPIPKSQRVEPRRITSVWDLAGTGV